MVTEAMKKYEIDPSQSYMFGDRKSDTECGERSGVKSFRVTSEHSLLYWANQLKTTYYEYRIKQYKGKEGTRYRRRDAGYLPYRGRERISPEAPVPVVRVTRTYNVLGGAANVARNLLGLGCSPYVVSLLGNDHNGNTMQEMFADLGIRNELFHTEHPTITKTRVIGNSQQVVRLDFETENECLNEETEQKLLDAVKRALPEVDIVVISDYGKGVCNDTVCQQVISASAGQGKKVIIDPKGTNWEKYRSATIITPNLKELSAVSGVDVRNEDKEIHSAADRILKEYNLTSLLVTRSEKACHT